MAAEMRLALLIGILMGAVSLVAGHSPLGIISLIIGGIAMWYTGWCIVWIRGQG